MFAGTMTLGKMSEDEMTRQDASKWKHPRHTFVGEISVDRMSVDEMTIDEMSSFLHQDGSQGTWTKVNSIILH